MEGVHIQVPVRLALWANSPFWRGDQTGLASTRAMVFSAFPRSGLPRRFRDYDD
jgi:carboxylate-amine ligase